jgi:hypothetical protein
MEAECSAYRSLIPRSMMGDLHIKDQQSLDMHLAECGSCRLEHSQYVETFRQMHLCGDLPVPKHFFVYSGERSENPWSAFRRMSFAWQGAISATVLLFFIFAAAAAMRLNLRVGTGDWILGFGDAVPAQTVLVPAPVIDTVALEARVLSIVEDRNRREKLESLRALRAEIAKSNRAATEVQRRVLQAAFTDMEARLGAEILETRRSLEDRSDRSLAGLYQIISSERARDIAAVDTSLSRLAANGEKRNDQTDAILETLLQVAELKLK